MPTNIFHRAAGYVPALFVAALSAAALPPAAFAGPIAWQGTTEIAAGRGIKGPWQQNDSRYDYVDDPTAAIDDRGEIAVAWVDQGRKDVLFQRFSADGGKPLAQPVNVSRNPETFSWLPRIAIAPDNPKKVVILWQEIIFSGGSHGGDMFFAASEDGGASFTPPVNLSDSVGGDGKGRINKDYWHNGSYDLIADRGGNFYAVWTEYDGPLWFARLTLNGNMFSRPRQLAGGDAKPVRGPALALGPDRTIYLAWTTGEDDAADIRLMKSTDGGAGFSAPQPVMPNATYSDAPKLAVDRDGVLHLAYAESAGGPFDRYHVLYTRSTDGGRTFDAPRAISEGGPGAGAAFPSMALDGKGRLAVLWEVYEDQRSRPRGLAIAASQDSGKRFSEPELVPGSRDPAGGTNGSHQGLLMEKLAMNDAGLISSAAASGGRRWAIRQTSAGTCG
jgi:hypothetical protein